MNYAWDDANRDGQNYSDGFKRSDDSEQCTINERIERI